jgi:prolyl 4-hydroxylase
MGKRLQNISTTSKLFCKFHSTNFFTKIAPLKLEIVNFSPFVGIFHDILSDNEIDVLKSFKSHEFHRATTLGGPTGRKVSKERTSMFKFLFDMEHKVINDLSIRVGDMSGLNMETAEGLQVQNYGIGGHYNMHHDYSRKGEDFNLGIGNRIATTLLYVS